uniref:Mucin-1 n=1 Tax=Neovison vison TaxID=452646 RepID=A0A8C7BYH9_NEOVI
MTPGFQAPLFLLLLHSGTSPTQVPPGHGAITAASTTPRGPEPPAISVFSLSFSIENRHFNSSLEDPGSSYYQELQRNISELFWQIYKKEGFLGLFNIKFRYRSGCGACGGRRWGGRVRWGASGRKLGPWLSHPAAERTVGSWTSFQPAMPITL